MTETVAHTLRFPPDGSRAWSRPPRRRFGPGAVELGSEAPLEIGGQAPGELGRHAISLRWLGASVLTGLVGGALLGSAIFVSTEGEIDFAEVAESAPATLRPLEDGQDKTARKGDKLVRAETVASAKQSFRSPVTIRVGEREIIKARSFVRLSTALSMTSGVYATNLPAFDPTRFFSDPGSERAAEAPPETSDADVSFSKSDLSLLALDFGGLALTDEDVVAQLREDARQRAEAGRRPALPALPSALMLSRTLGMPALPGVTPMAFESATRAIEVRVVPENVSSFEKAGTAPPDVALTESAVAIRRGDAPEAPFAGAGAAPDEARAIVAALGRDKLLLQSDSLQLRLLSGPPAQPGGRRRIMRATLMSERGIEAIAALNDRGSYVSVALPSVQGPAAAPKRPAAEDDEEDEEGTGVTLYNSLYETALKQEIPRATVDDLVRIFGYDVDFQRRVGARDTFELFYATDEEGGGPDRLEVLSAALTIAGEVHRVFRYQGDDGTVEYFDGSGRSLKKFLLRKPVPEGRISSPFGARYHPILGYAKMHTGVDFAAPTGTPIFAAGNGTVIKAEWSSGYGRRTEVQHANGYVTAYNHQSAFGRGIVAGAKVRQGQIIGYVGSSGLSTGAHLHYEVLVNSHFVDPMKIRLPRGRELDGRALAEFNRQRDQIDGLMSKAGGPSRLAQRDARG